VTALALPWQRARLAARLGRRVFDHHERPQAKLGQLDLGRAAFGPGFQVLRLGVVAEEPRAAHHLEAVDELRQGSWARNSELMKRSFPCGRGARAEASGLPITV